MTMIKEKIQELINKWESYRNQFVEGTPYFLYFGEMVSDLEGLKHYGPNEAASEEGES